MPLSQGYSQPILPKRLHIPWPRTEVGNPAILFMIEDTTPTNNPHATTVSTWLHTNAVNTWRPTGYSIHVVSVTRNKDESDAQKKA